MGPLERGFAVYISLILVPSLFPLSVSDPESGGEPDQDDGAGDLPSWTPQYGPRASAEDLANISRDLGAMELTTIVPPAPLPSFIRSAEATHLSEADNYVNFRTANLVPLSTGTTSRSPTGNLQEPQMVIRRPTVNFVNEHRI